MNLKEIAWSLPGKIHPDVLESIAHTINTDTEIAQELNEKCASPPEVVGEIEDGIPDIKDDGFVGEYKTDKALSLRSSLPLK